SARFKTSAKCDSASKALVLAETMSFSKESASCLAPLASAKAFDAKVSALPEEAWAVLACVNADVELARAVRALLSASPAFSLREPTSWPDKLFVLTRQTNSKARAAM